jgi:hypothetical protein
MIGLLKKNTFIKLVSNFGSVTARELHNELLNMIDFVLSYFLLGYGD